MKASEISGAIFLEVDLGLPRGPVEFMSPEWRRLFAYAIHEADRGALRLPWVPGRCSAAPAGGGSHPNSPCSTSWLVGRTWSAR